MMEQALRSRLMEDPAIKSIVDSRIDWGQRKAGYPCIVLKAMPSPRRQTYKGFAAMQQTRVQIDCMAVDRDTVIRLREAAIAAVVPAGTFHGTTFRRGFVDLVEDLGSQSGTEFIERDKIDVLIWHS